MLTEAAPGINKTINFQGKMTDDNGLNVADGNYQFVFRMYTVASGGSAAWTETVNLDVVDGIFHHQLGSTTALPGSVDFNTDNIFLGITFNSDPDGEMTPRIQLTATPYAFNADQLDGLDASDFVQLSPSTAQTGDIAITGSVSAGSAVFASDSTAALDVQTDVGDSVFRVDTTGTYPKVVFGDGIGTTLYNTSDWDLATGGNFYISDGSSAQVAIGDTGSGAAGIRFGSGLDTSLYRSGIAQLTLSGSFLTTGSTTLGDDASDALTITGTAVAIPNSLNFDSSTLFIDAANNRVGIGTAAPAETITVNGNFLVRDADTTTKAYRFRTSGYSLDIETAGQSLYISTFTNADFSGPQYVKLMFPENSNETQALGTWNFRTNPWDTIRHTIDAGASGNVVFNQNGAATDFTVQGDTVANLLFVDGSADSVTIGGQLVLTTVSGAGLTDCDGTNDKLVWDSSAMTFDCGIDGSGGVGAGIVGIGTINSATKHANGAVINGSDELIMQTADASFPGLVSTGTQTFGGNKTFNGTLTVSAAAPNSPFGASSLVNGNLTSTTNDQTAFFANPTIAPGSASSRVYSGILASPTSSSTNMASGSMYGVAGSVETTGTGTFGITAALFGQNSINSGTTATANAGVAIYNPNGTGSIGNNYGMFIQNQTRGTNDYALYIEGADTYALWVDAGASRLDGTLTVGGSVQFSALASCTSLQTNGSGVLSCGSSGGVTTVATFSGSSQANGASISGGNITFGPADGTNPGMVSTGTQTFAGQKTFTGNVLVQGDTTIGNASGDALTINGTNVSTPNNLNFDSNTFFIDAANNRIGVGTTTTSTGIITVGSTAPGVAHGSGIKIDTLLSSTSQDQTGIRLVPVVAPSSASSRTYSGISGGAYSTSTNLANASLIGGNFSPYYDGTGTVNAMAGFFTGYTNAQSGGTVNSGYGFYVYNPTNSGTITTNYGVFIADQTAGGSDYGLYIQDADTYALWVDAGVSRFDGLVRVGGSGTNSIATGDGDLYVQDALEVDGAAVFTTVSGAGLSDCDNATTSKLLWDSGTNTFSCGTDQSGGGGGSEWTDGGTFLYPSDSSGAEDIVIGGISTGAADIWLQATGAAIFNEQGAAVNFRVESDTNANMLLVDGANNRIGIGNASPVSIMQIGEYNENAPSLTFGSDAFADVYGISSFNNHLRLWAPEGIHIIQSYTDTIIATINSSGMALAGQLTIGTSNTTGTLLVLDTKTNSGDPTGVDGAMYYNSSYGGLRCYIKGEWGFCNQALSPSWGYDIRDDFMGLSNWAPGGSGGESIGELPWVFYNWGNGTNVGKAEATDAGRPGMYYFSTGSDTFGQASILLGNYAGSGGEDVIIDGGMEIEFAINIPTLANGTNDFEVRMGLCDDPQASGCVDGLYFEYDRDSSANWRMGASNNSSRTETNSSVAVTAGWHRFRIKVNSSVTSVEYFVDGTSLGTVTTNLPTSRATTPGFTIVKEAGTSARFMYIDYFWMHNKFTTPR